MGWISGPVVYALIWWLTLFTVLPLWSEPPEQSKTGNVTSAPDRPRLGRKFLITTIIAAVVWLAVFVLIKMDVIDFREWADAMVRHDVLAGKR
jgi:predicted secreted protein